MQLPISDNANRINMIADFESLMRPIDPLLKGAKCVENQIFNQIMTLLKPLSPADSQFLNDWALSVLPSVTAEACRHYTQGIDPARCSGVELYKCMKTLRFQFVELDSDTENAKALHATVDTRALSTAEIMLLVGLFEADLPSVNPVIGWFHCKFVIDKHDGYDQEVDWLVNRIAVGAWKAVREACRSQDISGFKLPFSILMLDLYMKITNDCLSRYEKNA